MRIKKSILNRIIQEELNVVLETKQKKSRLKAQFNLVFFNLKDEAFKDAVWTEAALYDNFLPQYDIDDEEDPKKEPKKEVNIGIVVGPTEEKENQKDKKHIRFYIYLCSSGEPPYTCSEPISKKIKIRRNVKKFFRELIRHLRKFKPLNEGAPQRPKLPLHRLAWLKK